MRDANQVLLKEINCSINGFVKGKNYTSIGGCIRLENIYIRTIKNVKIHDCFSDKTTFGFKIIDNPEHFIKIDSNLNPQVLLILTDF